MIQDAEVPRCRMITRITIASFKSIEKAEIDLSNLNVLVGANGSGKSNLLEAIGVLSAAADGKVTDQTLMQRGVRPGVPRLYKSAFPSPGSQQPSHIYFTGASESAHYDVSLNNPLADRVLHGGSKRSCLRVERKHSQAGARTCETTPIPKTGLQH